MSAISCPMQILYYNIYLFKKSCLSNLDNSGILLNRLWDFC